MEQYPNFFYQTSRGSLQNLSVDNLRLFEIENINLSFNQIYIFKEAIEKFNPLFTSKKYFNIGDHTNILISPLDIGKFSLQGMMKEDSVKVQVYNTVTEISNKQYLDTIKKINSDFIVCLSEQPKNDLGKKSFKRNVKKTEKFLRETIEQFPNKMVYVPLQLNTPQEFITEFLENIKQLDYYGIMLHDVEIKNDQVSKVLKLLAENDMINKIGLHGDGNVMQILFGLKNGISDFNCDYPFKIAKEGIALQFENDLDDSQWDQIQKIDILKFDFSRKLKNIQLSEEQFIKNFEPIQKNCRCYSCSDHTKAYIYHLIKCREMTAFVLLTIHNLHCYQNLLKDLKKSIDKEMLQKYICWFIQSQTQM